MGTGGGEGGSPWLEPWFLHPLATLFYTPYVVTPPSTPPLETRTVPMCAWHCKKTLTLFFQVMKVSLLQVQSCTRTRNIILVGNVIAAAAHFLQYDPALAFASKERILSSSPNICMCPHNSLLVFACNLSNTEKEHTTEFSFMIHIDIWWMLGTFLIYQQEYKILNAANLDIKNRV